MLVTIFSRLSMGRALLLLLVLAMSQGEGRSESVVEQWETILRDDTLSDGFFRTIQPIEITTDGSGNLAVAGSIRLFYEDSGFHVSKYSAADGSVLWHRSYPMDGVGRAVVADSQGDVYAAGARLFRDTACLYIAKHAGSDGTVLWQHFSGFEAGTFAALALDNQGNVLAAGTGDPRQSLFVAKYDGTSGALLWKRTLDEATHSRDVVRGLAVDAAGNVFICGELGPYLSASGGIYMAKYAGATGDVLWERRFEPASNSERFNALALDQAGDPIVAGYTTTIDGVTNAYTAKHRSSDGSIIWEQSSRPGSSNDVAVDSVGNVIVTGTHAGDIDTTKYAGADGALLWSKRFDGEGSLFGAVGDTGIAVEVDPSDNVFVAGTAGRLPFGISNRPEYLGDYYVAKYAASDGGLLWDRRRKRVVEGFSTRAFVSLPDGGVVLGTPMDSWTFTQAHSTLVKWIHPEAPVTRTLVSTGDPVAFAGLTIANYHVDGNATWRTFESPATNDWGMTAFRGRWGARRGSGVVTVVNDEFAQGVGLHLEGGDRRVTASFTDPVMDQDGRIANLARIAGPGVDQGDDTIADATGVPRIFAREGSPAPHGGLWESFAGIARAGSLIEGDGSLILEGRLTVGSGQPAVTTRNDAVVAVGTGVSLQSLVVVLREGNHVSGLPADVSVRSWRLLQSSAGSPGHSSALAIPNRPAFTAALSDGRGALLGIDGITTRALLLTGQGVASSALTGATWKSFELLATARDGLALLGTAAVEGSETAGIFVGNLEGTAWEPLVVLGESAAGLADLSISSIQTVVASPNISEGGIAFTATLSGPAVTSTNNSAIFWSNAAGVLKLLAREGDAAPDWADATWLRFESLALPGGGVGPLYLATVAATNGKGKPIVQQGVWGVDSSGVLRLLFRQGMTVEGKQVRAFSALSAVRGSPGVTRSFNNAGEIVWKAVFVDGSQAIVRTTQP